VPHVPLSYRVPFGWGLLKPRSLAGGPTGGKIVQSSTPDRLTGRPMKVLLIDPYEHDSAYGRVRFPLGAPSLGLAYLAAFLREGGVEVHILDARGKALSLTDVTRFAQEFAPDIVGVTSTTPLFGNAIQIAKGVKEALPDVQLVMGGPHITGQGAEVLEKWGFVDVLVLGEGESTLLDLARETPLASVTGIAYRQGGEVKVTPPRPLIEDLDSLPFPARDFYDAGDYAHPLYELYGKPMATILSTRGCPFQCSFCSSRATFGRRVRYRSVDSVMAEVDLLIEKHGVKSLKFADDTFALAKDRLTEICAELGKRGLPWIANARVNTITEEMVETMRDSGCRLLLFGLESGDQFVLNEIMKGTTIEEMSEVLVWTDEAGIDTIGTFIIGAPSETTKTAKATIDLAKELPLTFADFFILSPYPGTAIYEEMKRKGYMKEFEWTDVRAPKYGNPLVRLPNMSEEELIMAQKRAYRQFYLRPRYVLRLLRTVDSWHRAKQYLKLGLSFLRLVR